MGLEVASVSKTLGGQTKHLKPLVMVLAVSIAAFIATVVLGT